MSSLRGQGPGPAGSAARRAAVIVVALTVGGCGSHAPKAGTSGAPYGSTLACTLPTNCVDSLDGTPPPLEYKGSAPQAMAALKATLATFPEARVVDTGPEIVVAVFTTPIGFKDEVEFRIDAASRHIDFRSRSTLGLYDFGKNRSRMEEFAKAFEQQISQ